MKLFGKDRTIISVVIIEQTQLLKKRANWGFTLGGTSGFQPIAMEGGAEPNGVEYTFSVTYSDGQKDIVKAVSGTRKCEELLQIAYDPPCIDATSNTYATPELAEKPKPLKRNTPAPTLQQNQLPAGIYIIGKDIPVGTYDFHLIWGQGSIKKFMGEPATIGTSNYYQHVGSQYEYEMQDFLHVHCVSGEYLRIEGNLILGIEKSKAIELDL